MVGRKHFWCCYKEYQLCRLGQKCNENRWNEPRVHQSFSSLQCLVECTDLLVSGCLCFATKSKCPVSPGPLFLVPQLREFWNVFVLPWSVGTLYSSWTKVLIFHQALWYLCFDMSCNQYNFYIIKCNLIFEKKTNKKTKQNKQNKCWVKLS